MWEVLLAGAVGIIATTYGHWLARRDQKHRTRAAILEELQILNALDDSDAFSATDKLRHHIDLQLFRYVRKPELEELLEKRMSQTGMFLAVGVAAIVVGAFAIAMDPEPSEALVAGFPLGVVASAIGLAVAEVSKRLTRRLIGLPAPRRPVRDPDPNPAETPPTPRPAEPATDPEH